MTELRVAISNIAWDPAEDDAVAAVLRCEGARGIEIAPTKWRADPLAASAADVAEYRRRWEERGLAIVAMQSLLFGRPELQLFGSEEQRAGLADHLRRMIDLGAGLGAGALVFGSPKNRLRGALSVVDATARAVEFFRPIGEHASERGTALCIEPVPARYGADFLLTPAEATVFCREVGESGVRCNADLGAMILAGEDPYELIHRTGDVIAHYHASEPEFVVPSDAELHRRAARGLREVGYEGWVSIEIQGGGVRAVEAAVRFVRGCYGGAGAGIEGDFDGASS